MKHKQSYDTTDFANTQHQPCPMHTPQTINVDKNRNQQLSKVFSVCHCAGILTDRAKKL